MEAKYSRADKSFLIFDEKGDTGDKVRFWFSDLENDLNFEDEDKELFTFTLYYKKDAIEALDYASISNKEKGNKPEHRVGWIFPMSILVTENDDIRTNTHLSCYVFHAYQYLLSQPDFEDVSDFGSFRDVINSDKYKDACLLGTYKPHYSDAEIKKLELPLAKYGFYKHPQSFVNSRCSKINKWLIELTPSSTIVDNAGNFIEPYVEELLKHHLSEPRPFIKFLYLYQVIEVFLNKVLIKRLEDFLVELKSPTGSIRELSDELKNKNTEISRWDEIEAKASLKGLDYPELDNLCCKFVGRDDGTLSHPNSIYKVRNHITHRFRIAVQNEDDIHKINELFELYLLDLLTRYDENKIVK